MSASTYGSSLVQPGRINSKAPMVIAVCCACISLALVIGVGFASHTILRHVVQTLPCWVVFVLGLRRSRATSWVALPVFLFWLAIVVLIWLYLLGIARIVSGHFAPAEIAMTILVGMAAMLGIAQIIRFKSNLSPWNAMLLLIVTAATQWACFLISLNPAFAHR